MDYLREIAELEERKEELELELEILEEELMDEYEREEREDEIKWEIEDIEKEIEILENDYEEWKYSRGDIWKYNGISQKDFI